ncbi:MAG: hypothetical protein FJY92_09320 [Candidatus Hydrogenedentes bacterium]|nr:hypothetical protein [Candidatus Hydrogenedentota bacterium]
MDIVERKDPPPLAKRLMLLVPVPLLLWSIIPGQGALWVALAATALWIGFFGMLNGERKRDDFETGREILLSILRACAFGLAIGCWTSLIVRAIAG